MFTWSPRTGERVDSMEWVGYPEDALRRGPKSAWGSPCDTAASFTLANINNSLRQNVENLSKRKRDVREETCGKT